MSAATAAVAARESKWTNEHVYWVRTKKVDATVEQVFDELEPLTQAVNELGPIKRILNRYKQPTGQFVVVMTPIMFKRVAAAKLGLISTCQPMKLIWDSQRADPAKDENAFCIFVPIPPGIEQLKDAAAVRKLLRSKIEELVELGLLDSSDQYQIRVPVDSNRGTAHRGLAFVEFDGEQLAADRVAFVREVLRGTSWLSNQDIEFRCQWGKLSAAREFASLKMRKFAEKPASKLERPRRVLKRGGATDPMVQLDAEEFKAQSELVRRLESEVNQEDGEEKSAGLTILQSMQNPGTQPEPLQQPPPQEPAFAMAPAPQASAGPFALLPFPYAFPPAPDYSFPLSGSTSWTQRYFHE